MPKTVLITGSSSGIGLHLAKRLYDKGYHVIGVSRHKPNDILFDYYECDLSKTEDITGLGEQLLKNYSKIDVLVNCAGVGTGGALEEVSNTDTLHVFSVNVLGVMELTNHVIPLLKKSTSAKIINIGSVAGEITIPYQVSYSMSKSSVSRYTEGLRMELKPSHIDAMTILPGDTKTGFTNNRKVILNPNGLYKEAVSRSISKMEKDEQNGVSPLKVVAVIEKMIQKKRMPVSKIVGFDYKLLVFLSKRLPKKWIEFIVLKLYG